MNSTQRFSNRVGDYSKYRPQYPKELIPLLQSELGLLANMIVADIGSGTGISSLLFLENGNQVLGIEPNKEMREAQEQELGQFKGFKSIDGTAEATNLPAQSVDIIISAQAFHWFDKEKCKKEFARIVKPTGKIVLMWNSRNEKSDLEKAYEHVLIKYLEEYKHINHRGISDEEIAQFYQPNKMNKRTLYNEQILGLDEFKGRLRSSSYCPKEGELYNVVMKELDILFETYQTNGKVVFTYDTNIYWN